MAIDPNTFSGLSKAPDIYAEDQIEAPDIYADVSQTPPMSEEGSKILKRKIRIAIENSGSSIDSVRAGEFIDNGRETELRTILSGEDNLKAANVYREAVKGVIERSNVNAVTPLEAAQIAYTPPPSDPDTVIEKKYAESVVDKTLSIDGGNRYNRSKEYDQAATDLIIKNAETSIAKNAILDRIAEDYGKGASEQSWGGWAIDLAKGLFPGYVEYNQYKAFNSVTGGGFQKERERLLAIDDPVLFNKEVRASLDKIAKNNPALAASFAAELKHFGPNQEFMTNLFLGLDAATAASTAKSLIKAGFKPKVKDERLVVPKEEPAPVKSGTLEADTVFDGPSSTHPNEGGVFDLPTQMHPENSPVFDIPNNPTAGTISKGVVNITEPLEAKPLRDTVDTLQRVSDIASKPGATVKDVVAATGDIEKAARAAIEEGGTRKISIGASGSEPLKDVAAWADTNLAGIVNPFTNIVDSPFDTAKTFTRRLNETLEFNTQLAKQFLFDTNVISRIDKTADYIKESIEQATKETKKLYGQNSVNSIIDQKFIPGSKTGTNTDQVVTIIGKAEGTLFSTPGEAAGYAKAIGINGENLSIEKISDKYALIYNKIVDETDPAMRKHILYANTETPVSIGKMFIGNLISADQNLSKSQNQIRFMATNLQSEYQRLVNLMAKPIEGLTKKEGDRLYMLMDENAAVVRYNSNGNPTKGYFFKSPVEFSKAYYNKFGEYPTVREAIAYRTHVFLNDFDHTVRSISVFKERAQRGIGHIEFDISQIDPKTGNGKVMRSTPVEGKIVDNLPSSGSHDYRVAVLDKSGGFQIMNSKVMSDAEKKALRESIDNGQAKIAQLDKPSSHPLGDFFGKREPIEYVIAPDIKFSNLDLAKVLPYNEGGHAIENMGFRVKSARTGQTSKGETYFGEATFSGHVRGHEAKQFADDLNAIRVLYKDAVDNALGGPPDFRQMVAEMHNRRMPFGLSEVLDAVDQGVFNKDHPFAVVKDGSKYHDVVDVNERGLYNYLNSPHNMEAGNTVPFTGERGLGSQSFEKGGSNNPYWMPVKARVLDTRASVQQSMAELLRSSLHGDVLIKSGREFIEQFGDLLVGGKEYNRVNPIYAVLHPNWKPNASATDGVRYAAAKKMQTAVSQLLYSNSELSSNVMSAKEGLLNWAYKVGGNKVGDWLEDSALFKTRDPTRFLRGVAFHSTMGFFNPVQLALNTQTLFHMTAISPKHAPAAIKDSILMRLLSFNRDPAIVASMAKKSGYKHFGEMYDEMVRSGISDISGSIAHLDDTLSPKTVQTKFGRFLDASAIFFNESEAGLRRTSYSVAYREWRVLNPKAVIDDMARQEILGRAKVLNLQMTSDSQSFIQKGILSIPTQFTSYTMRLGEQLLEGVFSGKGALTRAETARAIGMYSLMYGIPTAVGAASGVIPVQEMFKKYAIDNGLDINADFLTTMLTQGVVQAVNHYMGGPGWNFAERWGPANNSIPADIVSGNKSLMELAMGPSGSMGLNIIKSMSPLTHALGSVFSEDPEVSYPLTVDDALDVARNIQTVNNATKAWMAFHYGQWISKSGKVQTSVDGTEAAFGALLGLSPQKAADVFPMQQLLKSYESIKSDLSKEITREFDLAMRYNIEGDEKNYDAHLRRATYLVQTSGLNPEDKSTLMHKMMKFHFDDNTELKMKILNKAETPEKFNKILDTEIKEKERNR